MSEYENVSRGKLKLKGVSDHSIKKKKKKKEKKKESEMYETLAQAGGSGENTQPVNIDKRTKAEKAFDKIREKKREQQILEKATKSHKDRIVEFNEHLDSLTEHFDIPKVSWTK